VLYRSSSLEQILTPSFLHQNLKGYSLHSEHLGEPGGRGILRRCSSTIYSIAVRPVNHQVVAMADLMFREVVGHTVIENIFLALPPLLKILDIHSALAEDAKGRMKWNLLGESGRRTFGLVHFLL
jgi:hypothetical protein